MATRPEGAIQGRRAVFADRDGVIIRERDLLTDPDQVVLLAGVAGAVRRLKQRGYLVIIVSNQAVVARGLCRESDVERIHQRVQALLQQEAEVAVDAYYFCPHHPEATVQQYRSLCDCRKPRPGMLHQAAQVWHLDLVASYMVGDRMSDIAAGQRAGCRSILVKSGASFAAKPIITPDPVGEDCQPDANCADFAAAVDLVLAEEA